MKERTIGIWLFTFLVFLVWLYFAANSSSIDKWWTVTTPLVTQIQGDGIQVISPIHVISPLKVLAGIVVFVLVGSFVSLFLSIKNRQ